MSKILFAFLLLFVCTTQGCIDDNEPDGQSLSVGEALPPFSVTLNTGATVSSASLKGKVGVIVFFNTGCSDCQKEFPVVQQLWDEYKGTPDVEILAIAREESKEEIMEYWIENGLDIPFSPQDSREIYSLFARSGIPRIYIANPQGIITHIFTDSPLATLSDLTSAVKAALK